MKKNMHIAHQRRQPERIQLVLSGVQCSRGLAVNHLTSKDREFRSFKFNIYKQRKWVNPIAAALLSSERRHEKCMLEQNHRTSGSPRPRCMSEEWNPVTYREKYVRSLKGTGPVLFFFLRLICRALKILKRLFNAIKPISTFLLISYFLQNPEAKAHCRWHAGAVVIDCLAGNRTGDLIMSGSQWQALARAGARNSFRRVFGNGSGMKWV